MKSNIEKYNISINNGFIRKLKKLSIVHWKNPNI